MAQPLKVALVGTGSIARAHLPAYRQFPGEVTLTAVCDIREEAAREFAASAGVEAVYTSMQELLEHADIEAVDICTIHDQHAQQVILAAQAGKHVLVEKPMAISIGESRAMIEATDAAGVTFMVAQVFRYLPHSRKVSELIDAGELGQVWALRSDDLHGSMPPASTVNESARPSEPSHWYFDGARAGGGALVTFATHHIDLFRYYLGDIRSVHGRCWTGHPMFFNGAEDRCWATLEFECGAVGNVYTSFTTRSPWFHRYWLYGEEGTVCSTPDPASHAAAQHHAPVEISSPGYGKAGRGLEGARFVPVECDAVGLPTDQAFVNEILHFAECCRTGKQPLSSGRDNLGTMKAVFGIYESARLGRPVDLSAL